MNLNFSLLRSASFQDDQLRNLFDLHNQERKNFEEFDRRYQEEMEALLRIKKDLQDSWEKEERREAFLQGKLEYIENEERRRREEKREIEAREERKKALEGREERSPQNVEPDCKRSCRSIFLEDFPFFHRGPAQ